MFNLGLKYYIWINHFKKMKMNRIRKFYTLLLFFFTIVISCKEALPPNIERARVTLNNSYDNVIAYEKNTSKSNVDILHEKYYYLEEQTLKYRKLLSDSNLIDRYNYDFEAFVKERAEFYLNKSVDKRVTIKTNTCNICNRKFLGRGYHESSNRIWSKCKEPYQCFICSPNCGRKHNGNWDRIYDELNIRR